MNKILLTVLSFVIFVLAGCSNGDAELEGKSLGLSSHNPTVSKEEAESADIKFSSGMLVFDFESSDEVTLTHNGNKYPGTYTLEDTDLTIDAEDGDASLKIFFTDFVETPDEYYSYTGKVENAELDDSGSKSQLSNTVINNLGMKETYIFLEED